MKANMWQAIILIVYFVSSSNCQQLKCPKADIIKPCDCYETKQNKIIVSQLVCTGNIIPDDMKILNTNLKVDLDYLHIHDTNLIDINSDLFIHFKNIFIENNNELKSLSGKPTNVKNVPSIISIKFNSIYEGDGLNDVLTAFKNSLGIIELNNNSISKLLSFEGFSSLETIRLENNKITEIPTGFIKGPQNLSEIRLDNNQIASIKENAFDFSNHKQSISIFLDNNKIKPDQLNEKIITMNNETIIRLDLENNNEHMVLSQSIKLFSSIVKNGGNVYLKSKIQADCSCNDTATEATLSQINSSQIWGLNCTTKETTIAEVIKQCKITPTSNTPIPITPKPNTPNPNTLTKTSAATSSAEPSKITSNTATSSATSSATNNHT